MKKITACLAILGMFFLPMTFGLDIKEGKHFKKIIEPCDGKDKCKNIINVTEYFTYICPGCAKLEANLKKWLKTKSADIQFIKIPMAFSSKTLQIQAKGYYVAKHFEKDAEYSRVMFRNIQKKHMPMRTEESIVELLVSLGIDKSVAAETMKSFALDIQLQANEEKTIKNKIFEMPTFVVNYKYKVNPKTAGGYDKLFEVVEHLLSMSRNNDKHEILR